MTSAPAPWSYGLDLPTAPDLAGIDNDLAVGFIGSWLIDVARRCGEPAIDRALAEDWPGTEQQRDLIPEQAIEMARNEARQIASETWAKEARERGAWGV